MIKTIGVFLQEQLLGMRWLNQLVGNLLQAIGIDLESRMGASVQFFRSEEHTSELQSQR